MGRIDDRRRELGVTVPPPPKPVANDVPAKRVRTLLYLAGQVSGMGGRDC